MTAVIHGHKKDLSAAPQAVCKRFAIRDRRATRTVSRPTENGQKPQTGAASADTLGDDMPRRLPEFDELVDLARNQPEELESLRQLMIDEVISSASSAEQRRRLEGLQFKVDMERRRAASPLAATIKLSEMMCQSLADLHRSLITPLEEAIEPVEEAIAGEAHGPLAAPRHSAKVLPFTRRYAVEEDPDLI